MVSSLSLWFQAIRMAKALFIGDLISCVSLLQRHQQQSLVMIFNEEITICKFIIN